MWICKECARTRRVSELVREHGHHMPVACWLCGVHDMCIEVTGEEDIEDAVQAKDEHGRSVQEERSAG